LGIYANRGDAYPFWTRILRETQQIMFFVTADIQEWSNLDELKKVMDAAAPNFQSHCVKMSCKTTPHHCTPPA
jgi:hypothetical protein